MEPIRKFRLNNNLSYIAIGALISCFTLALALVILPQLPEYPRNPGELRLFVSSWNFTCTLMWIVIFRIQVFHELSDLIERRRHGRRVTPWVRFWFGASILIGFVTLLYLLHSYATTLGSGAPFCEILTFASIIAWITLIASSIVIFRSRGCSKEILQDLKFAYSVHRWLLAPSSLLFFLSTFLFPIFFLIKPYF